jgi:hypothetical protein
VQTWKGWAGAHSGPALAKRLTEAGVGKTVPVIQSSDLYLDSSYEGGWLHWRSGADTARGVHWENPGAATNMGVETCAWSEQIGHENLDCRCVCEEVVRIVGSSVEVEFWTAGFGWPRTSAVAEDARLGIEATRDFLGQRMIERMRLLGINAFAGDSDDRACAQLGDEQQNHLRPMSLLDVLGRPGSDKLGDSGGDGPMPDR